MYPWYIWEQGVWHWQLRSQERLKGSHPSWKPMVGGGVQPMRGGCGRLGHGESVGKGGKVGDAL